MTINQIEYFIAIVENRTYLEAAEYLHISQSSLSKQIISLEHELDVTLFDRTRRNISLTEAGGVFYDDSKKMLEAYSEMRRNLKPFSGKAFGDIRLGTLPIVSQYGLTAKMEKFRELYSGVRLEIEEVEDEALLMGLKNGTYELAIVREEMLRGGDFQTELIAKDQLVVLTSRAHPLARKRKIALEQLKDEKFIMMNRYTSVFEVSIAACREAGFVPDIIRTGRTESIIDAVEIGAGVSLVCKRHMEAFKHDKVSILNLQYPVRTNVMIAWQIKKKLSKNARAFVEHVRFKEENYSV